MNLLPATNVILTNFMIFESYLNELNLQKMSQLQGASILSTFGAVYASQLKLID